MLHTTIKWNGLPWKCSAQSQVSWKALMPCSSRCRNRWHCGRSLLERWDQQPQHRHQHLGIRLECRQSSSFHDSTWTWSPQVVVGTEFSADCKRIHIRLYLYLWGQIGWPVLRPQQFGPVHENLIEVHANRERVIGFTLHSSSGSMRCSP